MMFLPVRDVAAEGIPLATTCEALGSSLWACDKWQNQPVLDRDWDDAVLVNAIVEAHSNKPEFGHRFLADKFEPV